MSQQIDVKAIFIQALELGSEDEVRKYMDEACAGPERRQEVEALLQAHGEAGEFLGGESPATETRNFDADALGQMIGPYKIREQIGDGGMGVVYVAEQEEELRRKVALKVIKPGMDSKAVLARFDAERNALALMTHPNIAKVLDAGTTEQGHPYFVMELIQGKSITEYCDQKKLTIKERLELFIRVCSAVQHAHQKGVIHRDIKPTNILVTEIDGKPVPKVIDFGVAKALGGNLTDRTVYTSFQSLVGTPLYMSPEQTRLSGVDVDTSSDVYSLGILLYELLTGTTPLSSEDLKKAAQEEVLRRIRENEPPRPSNRISSLDDSLSQVYECRGTQPEQLGRLVRGDLDWIVMKALEKERNRRYRTADAFAADISRHIANEPVEARPPSTAYRLSRFYRRNKMGVGVAAVLIFLLVAGVIGTTTGWMRARIAQKAAVAQSEIADNARMEATNAAIDANRNRRLAEDEREQADKAREIAEEELYIADMHLAASAYHTNNFFLVRRQLMKYEKSRPDLRGLEWQILSALSESPQASASVRHGGWSPEIALSPDGQILASVNRYGKVKLWNAQTLEEIEFTNTTTPAEGGKYVQFVERDATLLLACAGEEPKQVKFINVHAPSEVIYLEHREAITAASIAADGRHIATITDTGCILWKWEQGAEPEIVREIDRGAFRFVEFSPNSHALAFGLNGAVHVHNIHSRMTTSWVGHADKISEFAFSPDGTWLATGGIDGSIHLGNCISGEQRILRGHPETVRALVFSNDGTKLFSAGRENVVQSWEVATGRRIQSRAGYPGMINSIVFSKDGNTFFTIDTSGIIRRWNVSDFAANQSSFELDRPQLDSSAVDEGGKRLFIIQDAAPTRGLVGWNLAQCKPMSLPISVENVEKILVSSQDQLLALHSNNKLGLWDLATGSLVVQYEFPANVRVTCLGFSADGEWVAVGDEKGCVTIYRQGNAEAVYRHDLHVDAVACLALRNNASTLASIGTQGEVKISNGTTGDLIKKADLGRKWLFYRSVEFSPSEDTVAILWNGVRLWRWNEHTKLTNLPRRNTMPSGVVFATNGQNLVTTHADGNLRVWDTPTLRERVAIKRHQHSIDRIAHGGNTLVTFGRHGAARVWQLKMPQ